MTDDSEDDAREDAARDDGSRDDEDGDPFEWMRTESDREGDPFDHLPGPEADERSGDASPPRENEVLQPSDVVDPAELAAEDEHANGDPGATTQDDERPRRSNGDREGASASSAPSDGDASAGPGPGDGLGDDPFADVATPAGDPFEGDAGGVFERVDVDRVDPDHVWNEVTGEDATGEDEPPELTEAESRYAEVSKHAYCEQCEHFSAPPNVACANPGTEIVEFVDVETVRLLNCPIVAERAELENED